MAKNLIDRINMDMKISCYTDEPEENYFARIVYSAIASWMKAITFDREIFDCTDDIGVSKVHLLNRCNMILNEVIEMYPQIRDWFFPVGGGGNPIELIRDRMLKGSELLEIGYKTNVAAPSPKAFLINDNFALIRGVQKRYDHGFASGLAWIEMKSTSIDYENMEALLPIPKIDAEMQLNEVLQEIKWERSSSNVLDEYFDASYQKPLSQCWRREFKLKDEGITIGRKHLGNNFFEFYFVKMVNNKLFIHKIDDYLKEQNEIRRYMYGLKKISGVPVKLLTRKHPTEGLIGVKFYSRLPRREENILQLIGWPKNNIEDALNMIFIDETWGYVKKLLEKLDILI